jgi:hypothetical protein
MALRLTMGFSDNPRVQPAGRAGIEALDNDAAKATIRHEGQGSSPRIDG